MGKHRSSISFFPSGAPVITSQVKLPWGHDDVMGTSSEACDLIMWIKHLEVVVNGEAFYNQDNGLEWSSDNQDIPRLIGYGGGAKHIDGERGEVQRGRGGPRRVTLPKGSTPIRRIKKFKKLVRLAPGTCSRVVL